MSITEWVALGTGGMAVLMVVSTVVLAGRADRAIEEHEQEKEVRSELYPQRGTKARPITRGVLAGVARDDGHDEQAGRGTLEWAARRRARWESGKEG